MWYLEGTEISVLSFSSAQMGATISFYTVSKKNRKENKFNLMEMHANKPLNIRYTKMYIIMPKGTEGYITGRYHQ